MLEAFPRSCRFYFINSQVPNVPLARVEIPNTIVIESSRTSNAASAAPLTLHRFEPFESNVPTVAEGSRMRKFVAASVLGTAIAAILSACGGGNGYGGSNNGPPPTPTLDSYVGTTGVFVAWADNVSATFSSAAVGSYAGKKQSLRGTIDFLTGHPLGQPAGVEIYKGSDGFIHEIDLTSTSAPAPQQVSSENAATVDDACTLSGTAVAGANYDYVGVYFTADLVTPTNSSYVYRLPGPDGECNTADEVFHMVKTGMSAGGCAHRGHGHAGRDGAHGAGWYLGFRGQERREPGAGR